MNAWRQNWTRKWTLPCSAFHCGLHSETLSSFSTFLNNLNNKTESLSCLFVFTIKTFSTTCTNITPLETRRGRDYTSEKVLGNVNVKSFFYQRKRHGRDYIKTLETNISTKYEEERWKLNWLLILSWKEYWKEFILL